MNLTQAEHDFLCKTILLKISEASETEISLRSYICNQFTQTTFTDEEISSFENALATAFPSTDTGATA
jgi:hypothetical protein